MKYTYFEKSPEKSFEKSFFSLKAHLYAYPTNVGLTYFWNFGFIAGVFLAVQIFSGLFLSMHYVPEIAHAFDSVEYILREVRYGFWFKYVHANGASFYFIALYIHLARGIYYKSYLPPRHLVWFSGLFIFILSMATAFIGYVLPWGQMSLWGATVITNLFSAIPLVGADAATWIWGGFSVDNPTLHRFFTLHYLLPFIILGLVFIHLMLLHEVGSSQVHGSTTSSDNGPFGPLYFTKDWFGLSIFLFFYFYVVIYYPNLLGHPENFNPANPLVTPRHIVPEWYFLPFYAILRSVPSKLGGVMLMTWSLIMFFFLPSFWPLDGPSRSPSYTPLYDYTFTIFITSFISLGFFGSCPVSWVYILFSRVCTLAYFLCFFLFYLAIHLDRKATRLFFFFFGPIAEHTCL